MMETEKINQAKVAAWRSLGVLLTTLSLMLGVFVEDIWIWTLTGIGALLLVYPPPLWPMGMQFWFGVKPEKEAYYQIMEPTETHTETEDLRYIGYIEKEIK